MKAINKCFAVVLTAASLLTLGGCAKSTVSVKTATTANWNVRTSVSVEKNMLEYWQSHAEIAEYDISVKEGGNTYYSVTYNTADATYSTRFYAEASYDWTTTNVPAEFRVKPDESGKKVTQEPVYVYETSYKISGVYEVKSSGAVQEFDDELTSVCKYRLAGNNLQPVYSKQIVKNTAPNAMGTNNIEQTYIKTDAIFETWYNQGCTQAIVEHADNLAKDSAPTVTKKSISSKTGYSLFDNSQLRAAVRAFTMTGGATRTFNVFTPQNMAVQTCTATISSPVELKIADETEKKIIDALNNSPDDYIFFDGAPSEEGDNKIKNYRYNAVSLAISADMKGAAPTCWYSCVENADLNTTRSVLLKMTTPLSFALGTMTYTLKSLDVAEIN
ncbi:MAG: hypothetical protein K2L72_04930 [Clostridia bacterium]|nr:hypothetical protein [Clostridia bacterium]